MESINLPPIQRLKDMGFRKCGEWRLESERINYSLTEHAVAQNVLYVFISGNEVLYVGKTRGALKKRMYGYQNPGLTQSTNTSGKKWIYDSLKGGKSIDIYALADNKLLYYGGFHINLAAGLEDDLIAELKPKWNKLGHKLKENSFLDSGVS